MSSSMTIVPDTNIIISAQLVPTGNEARLLNYWQEGLIELALSEVILQEYERVLHYPHLYSRLHHLSIPTLIDALRRSARLYPGNTPVRRIPHDPSDEKFLACALEANADALVSGDTRHLLPLGSYQGIPIVTSRACLDWLKELNTRRVA